jgi:hypothetical protein
MVKCMERRLTYIDVLVGIFADLARYKTLDENRKNEKYEFG